MNYAYSKLLILFSLLILSCSKPSIEKGVSLELAQARKKTLSEIQYNLHFDIPKSQTESIAGKNTITFLLKKDDSKFLYIDFNEQKEKLHKLSVNQKETTIAFENEHLSIPMHLLVNGKNEISIEFTAGDLSLNRNEDYLYTLFVPDRASTCFPGFDQPDLKASISLSLLIPQEWEAISNQRANVVVNEGKKEYQFLPTKPLSTYQFAFAVGKFEKATDPESGMTMFYRETDSVKVADNLKDIFSLHTASLNWLKTYTGISYPFSKFDFALLPSFQYGGMEHPGSIFYRESSLILNPSASVNQKMRRASLIAHETAHMWFGNLVTMKWFTDVWLKEVFANFMAAKIVNPQFPEINHDLRFLMAHYPSAYSIDRSEGSHPIQQKLDNLKNAGTLYGGIIYQKAPIMMRNLESMMGEENFQKGLRDYLEQYAYQNASWDDLINSLKKFTNKDLEVWNIAWIKTKGMPDISYSSGSEFNIKVTNDSTGIVWPQTFQYQFVENQSAVINDITIESEQGAKVTSVSVQANVIPNYKGRGYGYFAADEKSRNFMLASVNSVEDTEARAAVWLNIWEYVLRGELNAQQSMETMLSGITTERDPLIMEYITNTLNTLFWQFTKPEDRQLISKKIDDTLFEVMALEKDISLKRVLFNCYKEIAISKEGVLNLKKFWGDEMTLGLEISEQDHIELAYELAVRDAEGSDGILRLQLANTKNPDRKEAMEFIKGALSKEEAQRDAFFESLKDPANREHEPWVLEALKYLNHPLRANTSVKYVKPSLEMLSEIQLTGDIFFPKGWVDQSVSAYQSQEAAATVKQFLKDNPNLSPNLRNKLLQSADMLFRAERILYEKPEM